MLKSPLSYALARFSPHPLGRFRPNPQIKWYNNINLLIGHLQTQLCRVTYLTQTMFARFQNRGTPSPHKIAASTSYEAGYANSHSDQRIWTLSQGPISLTDQGVNLVVEKTPISPRLNHPSHYGEDSRQKPAYSGLPNQIVVNSGPRTSPFYQKMRWPFSWHRSPKLINFVKTFLVPKYYPDKC